jgi:hypothetical protein
MVQDKRGVFYFATQAGVLQFDGRNWDSHPHQRGCYMLLNCTENGEVYVGRSKRFWKDNPR